LLEFPPSIYWTDHCHQEVAKEAICSGQYPGDQSYRFPLPLHHWALWPGQHSHHAESHVAGRRKFMNVTSKIHHWAKRPLSKQPFWFSEVWIQGGPC